MKFPVSRKIAGLSALLALPAYGPVSLFAQDAAPLKLSANDDHQNMMDQLHITEVRPGKSGNAGQPNQANYDESIATAPSPIPDALTMKDGRKVTSAAMWEERRKEIQADFDTYIYGKVPEAAQKAKVVWTVTNTTQSVINGIPVITRTLNGRVDNSFYPQIEVNIQANVTTPANAKGKVPVLIQLGGGLGGGGGRGRGAGAGGPPPLTMDAMKQQLTLTDAQIAQITPLVDEITKAQTALAAATTKAQTDLAAARTKAITDVAAVLTTAQRRQFNGFASAMPATLAGGLPLPTLAALQANANLALTEAQLSAIKPILDELNKAQSDLTDVADENTALRTTDIAKIAEILVDAQKGQFATLAGPGRGARGAANAAPRAAVALDPRATPSNPQGGPSYGELALAKGWGYGSISTNSIQADNGTGFTATGNVVALFNKGQVRKPDDWGTLRAWGWGVSKLVDFFQTDSMVDGAQIGIEGHSRWGKGTAVALAYDPRIAIGYVSSSGEGGMKIWRHMVGETVENLSGGQEYHWMAGNFILYASPGHDLNEMPIDAHELVDMVAPRPVFIGGGANGDAWQDPRGMFMAAAMATPVYELLGKKGVGTMEMPPVQVPMIDGDVGFRYQERGHEDGANWPTFIEFASHYLHAPK